MIVRVYEAHGKPAEARLRPAWPVAHAEEIDLIEHPIADLPLADGAVMLKLVPHEIKTIRLICD